MMIPASALRRIAPRVALWALLLAAFWAAAFAQAQVDRVERDLQDWKQRLQQLEATVQRPDLAAEALTELREQVEALREEALQQAEALKPAAQAAQRALNQLGPKPEKGSETEAIAAQRAQLEQQASRLGAAQKQLDLLLIQAEQLSARAGDLQRERFFRLTFQPSRSILDPQLWLEGFPQVPVLGERLLAAIANGLASVDEPARHWELVKLIGEGLGVVLAVVLLRIAARWLRRSDRARLDPRQLDRLLRAARIVLIAVASFALALWLVQFVFASAETLTLRLQRIIVSALEAALFLAFARAFTRAVLAPGLPQWRLAELDDVTAPRLAGLINASALVIAADWFLADLNEILFMPLPLSIMLSALASLAIAALIVAMLQLARPELGEAPAAPQATAVRVVPRAAGFRWVLRVRWLYWLAAAAIAAALLLGYVALAHFLAEQAVVTGFTVAGLYLLHHLGDAVTIKGLKAKRPIGRFLREEIGLRDRGVERLGVLLGMAFDLALVLAGLPLLAFNWAATWAWTDLRGWFTTAFFGFKVGGVTVSVSTVFFAAFAFVLGLGLTRLVTYWLDSRILTRTQIDKGVRDSIRTGAGYLGFILAAVFALSYAGVEFSNLALIAGALGVGIGFGLQSIVNNFVSGLILLAERPIKVGDWIQVAAGEGYVKRINVRSTVIETFDKAAVIVPNSSLISEAVQNWTHSDTMGRVRIPLRVARSADPRQVHDLLIQCAKAHARVLPFPPAEVFFMGFGEQSLDFELRVFIPEVDYMLHVASDLRFAIFSAIREAGIEIPFPQRDVYLHGLEPLQHALSETTMAPKSGPRRAS